MADPPGKVTSLADDALIAFDNLADLAGNLIAPSVRLGVTGLSRSGKTIFITALVHNLIHGGRLPLFEPHASGRIARALLTPQPNFDVPRFQYEDHVRMLVEERTWPHSTRAISELRLTIEYESASAWNRMFGSGRLNIDIVDYPGEWLLDLPLLGRSFAQWSRQALTLASTGKREPLAAEWRTLLADVDPRAPADEMQAQELALAFTAYLRKCREDETALSTLPPGRFLMPGDLEGSPALTFSPLDVAADDKPEKDSLHAMMDARYEAYKSVVVKPFFREHFARLDRQIVLVDVLQAINAGTEAVADLEIALADILACFRPGKGSILSSLFGPRIDRILFAATKADHLHHENHDRLEALLERLVEQAAVRAKFAGARVDVLALAAIRATKEAMARHGKEELPVIIGTPLKGETIEGESFDGETETAIFPGDLPSDPNALLKVAQGKVSGKDALPHLRFVRFRPPSLEKTADGLRLSLPHIRLDRALSFLLADKLA
ncbi:MAG: YcjX family protein [Salaquimonas sp.]|nr:YcjX family protein [Salaquimonas sp.]